MTEHKAQPSYGQDGITSPWEPLPDEVKIGLELAAYICRMYGDGERWAEIILSHGEQVRARWWMGHERKEREREIAEKLGLSPHHPMVREAVEIERGERNSDGSWIK